MRDRDLGKNGLAIGDRAAAREEQQRGDPAGRPGQKRRPTRRPIVRGRFTAIVVSWKIASNGSK